MNPEDELAAELEQLSKIEHTEQLSNQPAQAINNSGIIVRKFFQMTVMRIYPNGNVSIDTTASKSWFSDNKEMWKKKAKAKPKPLEQTKLEEKEEW